METSPENPEIIAQAKARVGQTLRAKWHLDALIEVGGMAAIYAATHRNGNRAAVKLLRADRAAVYAIVESFLREGRFANRVDHPGAVRVLDDDVDHDGSAFLVMELLEGSSLYDLAARRGGRLPTELVLRVADQLLDVLVAAHHAGIVHRDVKPENVFLTRDGRIKLLDFGLAVFLGTTVPANAQAEHGPMGTPGFMPPEQAHGRLDLAGPQSDVWSVGATMFTLLTGQFVHPGESATELLEACLAGPARPLSSVMPSIASQVARVVDRALEQRQSDRWQDAREMQRALREAAHATEARKVTRSLAPQRHVAFLRGGARTFAFFGAAATIACVLVAGGAVAGGHTVRARSDLSKGRAEMQTLLVTPASASSALAGQDKAGNTGHTPADRPPFARQ